MHDHDLIGLLGPSDLSLEYPVHGLLIQWKPCSHSRLTCTQNSDKTANRQSPKAGKNMNSD